MFLRQIAKAMNVLQTKGIIHRDLKPQNVLLCHPDGCKRRPKNTIIKIGIDLMQELVIVKNCPPPPKKKETLLNHMCDCFTRQLTLGSRVTCAPIWWRSRCAAPPCTWWVFQSQNWRGGGCIGRRMAPAILLAFKGATPRIECLAGILLPTPRGMNYLLGCLSQPIDQEIQGVAFALFLCVKEAYRPQAVPSTCHL